MTTHLVHHRLTRRAAIGAGLAGIASAACAQVGRPRPVFPVREYGARGNGTGDDAPAIQRAIDAAARAGGGIVRLGRGTFTVRLAPAVDGGGLEAIRLQPGVILEGGPGVERARSVLRLADGQRGPGTFARIISSARPLRDVAVRGFTLDGNRAGQGAYRDETNGGAIMLGWHSRLEAVRVENMHVHDANGQAIMLLGSPQDLSRDLVIADNLVERASFIGIQSSQFDGLVIENNVVRECGDNCIDVYGDNDITHSTIATSRNGLIRRNMLSRGSVGVFLETVAQCRAVENVIADCTLAGVAINRIHGEPRELTVSDNSISGTPIGFAISGDTGGVLISDNTVRGFAEAGIRLSYNVSKITARDNLFVPVSNATPIVLSQPVEIAGQPPNQLVWNRITGNTVPRDHREERLFVNRHQTQIDNVIGRFVRTAAR